MSKFSVIVFDLGNVLIPFDYSITKRRINEVEEGLGDLFEQRYIENMPLYKSYEKWELTDEQFLDEMMKMADGKLEREQFCRFWSEIFTVNEDVASLLPKLKENYTLVLLSNTTHIHQKYGWGEYSFLEHFDKLILSHEVGAYKPEEKIYRAVEAFTDKPSNEHFFTDDIAEYIEGAKKCGWDAAQFTGYENLVKELKKREILF